MSINFTHIFPTLFHCVISPVIPTVVIEFEISFWTFSGGASLRDWASQVHWNSSFLGNSSIHNRSNFLITRCHIPYFLTPAKYYWVGASLGGFKERRSGVFLILNYYLFVQIWSIISKTLIIVIDQGLRPGHHLKYQSLWDYLELFSKKKPLEKPYFVVIFAFLPLL